MSTRAEQRYAKHMKEAAALVAGIRKLAQKHGGLTRLRGYVKALEELEENPALAENVGIEDYAQDEISVQHTFARR